MENPLRKITPVQIAVFVLLFAISTSSAIVTGWLLARALSPGDFRGVVVVVVTVLLVYVYAIAIYRLFLALAPLQEGPIPEGSRSEFAAQVNILFYLILFNSLIRTHFLPIPMMRLVYRGLGARMGANTYSAGALLDPPLTNLGANCVIGHDAVLFCHVIEGRQFALLSIHIGDNVTVGASAVIMPGVTISEGAIVSAGALVLKNSRVGPYEIWGGMPAKRIGLVKQVDEVSDP